MKKSVRTVLLSVIGGLILCVIGLSITSFKSNTTTEITQNLNIKSTNIKVDDNWTLNCEKNEATQKRITKVVDESRLERKENKDLINEVILQQKESNTLLRLLIKDKKLVYEEGKEFDF